MLLKHTTLGLLALSIGFASCSKDDEAVAVQLRTKMDPATLTNTTPYTTAFVDANSTSTVDVTTGNQRLDMFSEFNSYMAQVATAGAPQAVDAAKLQGMYNNTGNYFSAASNLNTSGLQMRSSTAASFAATSAEGVRTYIDQNITKLGAISQNTTATATAGNAGHLGRYLVDEKGIEVNQVIQKALIGGLLLDQVNNVLLSTTALSADNSTVVAGKTYTALEHNWDLAYGTLTKKSLMNQDYTTTPREVFLAGYLNEKNTTASPRVYLALLKGRAAIVNNDKTALNQQADIIRTELEKTIALAAVSYLNSWKSNSSLDTKAHAMGEALGFIYSMRFCTTKYKADAAFSDAQLTALTSGPNGVWSLTNAQADAVIAAINTKFVL